MPDGGQSVQLANVVLLPVLLDLVTCIHHGLHDHVVRQGLILLRGLAAGHGTSGAHDCDMRG